MYNYEPRPKCSKENLNQCNSPYLWCDPRPDISRGINGPHCVSKIKINGNCRGFEGFDACYNSVCIRSICQPGQFNIQTTKKLLPLPPLPTKTTQITTTQLSTTQSTTTQSTTTQLTTTQLTTTPITINLNKKLVNIILFIFFIIIIIATSPFINA